MWKWIKVPKGIALLAFLLPWLTVSCQNQPLAKASGIGLAFGHVTTMGEASGRSGEVNLWLVLAILAIIGGLVLAFMRDRGAAKISLATSVAAFLLIWIGTGRYSKSALLAEAGRQQGGGDDFGASMGNAMMSAIQINWHFGYYLCLLALVVAAVMAGLVMTGRDAEASERLAGLAGDARKAMEQAAAAAQAAAAQAGMAATGGTCPKCGKKVAADVRFCPDDGTPIETPPPPPPPPPAAG